MKAHPKYDEYWEEKRAAVENINIPAYVVASWANILHSMGTFEAWSRLQTKDRWLRIHNSLEWPDYYSPEGREDLCRFFDRYLRDVDNDWESTPRVRLTVMDFIGADIKNRAEAAYPLARAKQRVCYLDAASQSMVDDKPSSRSTVAYDAESGETTFRIKVDAESEITGYCNLKLFVEIEGHDDADIFAKLVTLGEDGEVLGRVLLPREIPENDEVWDEIVTEARGESKSLYFYDGPWGRKRVSHRADADSPDEPAYFPSQKVNDGEIVEISIRFNPTAMKIRPGQVLQLTLSGVDLTPQAVEYDEPPKTVNRGRHVIHTGGDCTSQLILPIV